MTSRAAPPPRTHPPFVAVLGVLGLLAAWHLSGLFLFTSGFLLQRVELHNSAPPCAQAPRASWPMPTPPHGASRGETAALEAWDAVLRDQGECSLPPRYKRAVVWIIDALRYDFVAEALNSSTTPNMYMHNLLRTPAELHKREHGASIMAHFVAHPPTTTLQRLKGLTTGSLPTFIEAGANFGGAGRVMEDNWIEQVRVQPGRERLVFVGDDTWQMVFADLFDESYPYSSFNVEDLDTVDAGVEHRMLSTMDEGHYSLVIGHSLGVDHVGHRFGPAHTRMPPKLEQMDRIVQEVLKRLPEDTLFVLLGDHGMDATGDHGGDSELEIGSALWMYARRPFDPAAHPTRRAKQSLSFFPDVSALLNVSTPTRAYQPFSMLPVAEHLEGHRSFPQIDLVPTLSLLLGVPVPFNSLGTIIPEAFASTQQPLGHKDARLLRALRINARQVRTYLHAYATQSRDLAPFETELQTYWHRALQADAKYAESPSAETARVAAAEYMAFTRAALDRAQSVWAQFDHMRIALGATMLLLTVVLTWMLWRRTAHEESQRLAKRVGRAALHGGAAGVPAGVLIGVATHLRVWEGVLTGAALGALITVGWSLRAPVESTRGAAPRATSPASTWLAVVVVGVHAMLFASNSFTMWEDRITLALLAVLVLGRGVLGLGAPLVRWQYRLPFLAVISVWLVRLAAMSRVCREEQAPYCTPTFYARHTSTEFADNPAYALSGPATNSPYVMLATYVVALALADVVRRLLMPSRAHLGSAAPLLQWIVRPAMLGAAGFWLADWVHGLERWDEPTRATFLHIKMLVARAVLVLLIVGALYWCYAPLSLSVLREPAPDTGRARVMILGFGNALGSAFLLGGTLMFVLLFLLAQPMGQLALTACFLAVVLLAELGDHERDARMLAAAKRAEAQVEPLTSRPLPTLLEMVCLVLTGFVAFFGTGHQATFTAIQWRVAFVGFKSVTYPWSPLFVVLNAFGPMIALPIFGAVLLALWNVAPHRVTKEAPSPLPMRVPSDALYMLLGVLWYWSVIALSAAGWAYYFRRHLMLFKIWVPRFMTAALGLIVADVLALCAMGALLLIATRIRRAFGSSFV
ncbi:mannose-ethanolamine phosphotransferase gpi13 [Malassezia equina]|uniref:Mannose-ethanolamine phosphotransferase gpi13 n=1 Tax=Malassezia equina TaxID=1381935 RepID=A0AAF0IYY0_9BASI|nr:mannose-ethanolamine phosphotransferase gpi13 [Malassezia equina]